MNSSFHDNAASDTGGAIQGMNTGKLVITESSFAGNSARWGGVLDIASGDEVSIANSTFSGNEAESSGGVLSVGYTKVYMTHVTMAKTMWRPARISRARLMRYG